MDEELAASISELARTLRGSNYPEDRNANLLEEIRDKLVSIDLTLNKILDAVVRASPSED